MAKPKRCKSISPVHGFRCEKLRKHNDAEVQVTHQQGDITWHDTPDGTAFGAAPDPGPQFTADNKTQFTFIPTGLPDQPVDITRFVAGVNLGPDPDFDEDDEYDEPPGPNMPPTQAEADRARSRQAADLELRGWWFDLAEREINGTVPKAIEYSSTDLVDIGRTLAFCMGRDVGDEEAAELGIFFYMQGKMSRWAGAIKTGKRVSDDTLFDIGVYVRMTQRVRDAGGWPGVTLEGE